MVSDTPMQVLKIDPHSPQPEVIAQAARFAQEGNALIFPTDTVYGIGVAALDTGCPQAIYAIKDRDRDKAIPWLVQGTQALEVYGRDIPTYAWELAELFWPGALTLIVKASPRVPRAFQAQDGSIALRAPASPVALALIARVGVPLATSSANRQGGEPAISLESIDPTLTQRVSLALDGGVCPLKTSSTVVSCINADPLILRPGALAQEVDKVLGKNQGQDS